MGGQLNPNNMKEVREITVKTFDVYDKTLGRAIIDNLKTFEEAEAFIIAHDKKMQADWVLSSYQDPEHAEEFKHHRYFIFHSEGKIIAYTDDIDKMSFADLCDEAAGWRATSVVELKF